MLRSSEQIKTANVDSDSNSSEPHRDERNSSSQAEGPHQIVHLQTEINAIKTLLATFTQQVISQSEEGTASRAAGACRQPDFHVTLQLAVNSEILKFEKVGKIEKATDIDENCFVIPAVNTVQKNDDGIY